MGKDFDVFYSITPPPFVPGQRLVSVDGQEPSYCQEFQPERVENRRVWTLHSNLSRTSRRERLGPTTAKFQPQITHSLFSIGGYSGSSVRRPRPFVPVWGCSEGASVLKGEASAFRLARLPYKKIDGTSQGQSGRGQAWWDDEDVPCVGANWFCHHFD